MLNNNDISQPKIALMIAHPAHELLLYGWLVEHRPTTYVLTHGASFGKPPRIGQSQRLLESVGCRLGTVFGEIEDAKLYQQLLDGQFHSLLDITWRLAQGLIDDDISMVVGDAAEGEILAHDVWRAMIDAAVDIAQAETGHTIQNYEFSIEMPGKTTTESADESLEFQHNDDTWRQKMAVIGEYAEIAQEKQRLADVHGIESLRRECFQPASSSQRWLQPQTEPTTYERHGAMQVQVGRYRHSITHQHHLLPFVVALAQERRRGACRLLNAS